MKWLCSLFHARQMYFEGVCTRKYGIFVIRIHCHLFSVKNILWFINPKKKSMAGIDCD